MHSTQAPMVPLGRGEYCLSFHEHLPGRSGALVHCSRKPAVFRFADMAFEWNMWEMLSFCKSILKNSQMQELFILNVGNSV